MKKLINYIQQNAAQGAVNVGALAIAVALLTLAASNSTFLKQAASTDIAPATDGIQHAQATASANPMIGDITIFPYGFAPRGWVRCDGGLYAIAQNTALFSLIGTTYGGDGRTTFGVPDLQGRMLIGKGRGAGLSNRVLGQKIGIENRVLSIANLPNHNHVMTARASDEDGEETDPTGQYLGAAQDDLYMASANAQMAADAVVLGSAGSPSPSAFTNMPPVQVLDFYICTTGVYPSRN